MSAGIRSALVVVGPRAVEIEKRFGKGIRWGIALEYVRREEEETTGVRPPPPRAQARRRHLRPARRRARRGRLRRVRWDGPATGASRSSPAVSGERLLGMWRVRPEALKKAELPRDPADADWTLDRGHAPLDVGLDVAPARRPRALERARPGRGQAGPLAPRDRRGVREALGRDDGRRGGGRPREGDARRRVGPAADRHSRGVALSGVAVSQNLVVDPATGATSLLTDLLPASRGAARRRAREPARRPRPLPSLAPALARRPRLVARRQRGARDAALSLFAGNGAAAGTRETVRTFRFETAIPVFRDLPLLLSRPPGLARADGRRAPRPRGGGRTRTRRGRPRAARRPSDSSPARGWSFPASAPPEVARVIDAFDSRSGCRGLVALGLATFFSARAWTAPKGWNPDGLPETEK
ncbi:MAG: hypothetical protein M0C28_16030 [Candidatus Moduliflexus flocculans]|nr:hypothetical protein [Candidatus Moduliflexus flocculans]